ncbi:GNAT family N-acetyltransferase [Pedobacter sp. UC225_65]|uniref:GNAT family N-acetyltransferase n=1 Tax=Pedobacter sp. UC225_65 TaxID=3350173 RepID=UPI00366DE163
MITTASEQDAKELNVLINAAYRGEESKKGWTTEAEILGGLRIDEMTLKGMLAQGEGTIVKYTGSGEEILGTVYLEIKMPALYLGMFAVSPLSQSKGIGKALLSFAEDFALAHGCDRITLTVISIREELIDWYKRHGYVPTGHSIAFEDIEGRFGDPKVDAIELIEMQKSMAIS